VNNLDYDCEVLIDELIVTYSQMADEELLELAASPDELLPEAKQILASELARRNLGKEQIETYRKNLEAERKAEETEKNRAEVRRWGITTGRNWFFKADLTFDNETDSEQFTTTVFSTMAWFLPLIPLGTYRVQRSRSEPNRKLEIVKKLPLNWEQVLRVWVVSSGSIFAVILAIRLWFIFGAKR
jgi:hypothetical protein